MSTEQGKDKASARRTILKFLQYEKASTPEMAIKEESESMSAVDDLMDDGCRLRVDTRRILCVM